MPMVWFAPGRPQQVLQVRVAPLRTERLQGAREQQKRSHGRLTHSHGLNNPPIHVKTHFECPGYQPGTVPAMLKVRNNTPLLCVVNRSHELVP